MRPVAALAAFAFALPALAQEQPPKPFTVVGKPQACVNRSAIRTIRRVDDRALYLEMRGGPDYRSDLASDCGYDPRQESLVMGSTVGTLCEGEAARRVILSENFFRGTCIFGPFTPVRPDNEAAKR